MRTSILMAALWLPSLAHAQAALVPNQIHGVVGFSNQDPDVVDLMLGSIGGDVCRVWATSTAPTGFSSDTGYIWREATALTCPYAITAEASGGVGEVTYGLSPAMWLYHSGPQGSGDGQYWPQPATGVVLRPEAAMPGGQQVDFLECVGVAAMVFRHDCSADDLDAPGNVVAVNSGRLNTPYGFTSLFANQPVYHYFAPDGAHIDSVMGYALGTDPYEDTIAYHGTVTFDAVCDQIHPVCIEVPGASTGLGAITGGFDVVGHEETAPFSLGGNGPGENVRYTHDLEDAPYNAPLTAPSTWWELPNLVPGPWRLSYTGYIGRGYDFQYVSGDRVVTVDAVAGTTTTGDHPFVMQPAYFSGLIDLRGSPTGTLSTIQRATDSDPDADGIPDPLYLVSTLSHLTAIGGVVDSHTVYGGFSGDFDPSVGLLSGSYQQVLPAASSATVPWRQDALSLVFWSEPGGDGVDTVGSGIDPSEFRYGWVKIGRPDTKGPIASGTTVTVDHDYCFSEVRLGYSVTGTQRVLNPVAGVNGASVPSAAIAYTVDGEFSGTPWLGYQSGGITADTRAAPTGLVAFALPEGSYTITPRATLVTQSGTTSVASFSPIDLDVGCLQEIAIVPGLAVSAGAECADPESGIRMVGAVTSNGVEVNRVWITVGGSEVEVCTACGSDPTFDVVVDETLLSGCSHDLTVHATSGFIAGAATVTSTFVYNNPFDGVLCDEGCGGAEIPPDACETDPDKTEPGECGCGFADLHSDADGVADCNDACPYDDAKVDAGSCGCGEVETDTDKDLVPDCNDECPSDPYKIDPGECGCGIDEAACLNECPTLPELPNLTSTEGESVSFTIVGADADGDPLEYVTSPLPAGVVVNATTGAISGTLATGAAGTSQVTVGVSDGECATTRTFTWVVAAKDACDGKPPHDDDSSSEDRDSRSDDCSDHDSESEDHDSQSEDHDSQSEDHDSQSEDHDSESKDHDSKRKDHDSGQGKPKGASGGSNGSASNGKPGGEPSGAFNSGNGKGKGKK